MQFEIVDVYEVDLNKRFKAFNLKGLIGTFENNENRGPRSQ